MKITTQRTMLWTADFVLVAALIGLVLMIAQKRQSGASEHRRHMSELDDLLEREKKKAPEKGGGADTGPRTPTVTGRDFHYAGYVAPPPPPDKPPAREVGPPALDTLIEVVFLMASSDAKGPNPGEGGGATITIKSLPPGKNTFFYLEGELIGVGAQTDETENSARLDEDPVLKKWGGALLKQVTTEGIVCRWGKKDAKKDVKVGILMGEEPAGAVLKGPDGFHISGKGGPGGPKATASRSSNVIFGNLKRGKGGQDIVELTKEGFERLENAGSEVLKGITFEDGKNADGGRALKIKAIPRELQGYGLQDGDVIVKIDSTSVTSKASIANYVRRTYKKQSRYNVTVLREGQERRLKVDVPRNFNERQNLKRRLGDGNFGVDPDGGGRRRERRKR